MFLAWWVSTFLKKIVLFFICDPPYEKGAYGNFQKMRLNTAFKRFSNMFQTVLKHVWNGKHIWNGFETNLFETVFKKIVTV